MTFTFDSVVTNRTTHFYIVIKIIRYDGKKINTHYNAKIFLNYVMVKK